MNTREIKRDNWNDYMNSLTTMCMNRPVTVEVSSEEIGDQELANHAPFLSMHPELKGSEECAIDIELARPGSTDRMTHEVRCAKRVMVREDEEGQPVAIDIEGEDPSTHTRIKTIIHFD